MMSFSLSIQPLPNAIAQSSLDCAIQPSGLLLVRFGRGGLPADPQVKLPEARQLLRREACLERAGTGAARPARRGSLRTVRMLLLDVDIR